MELITRSELKDRFDSWEDLKLVFALGDWQYRAMHIPGSCILPCSLSLYTSPELQKRLYSSTEALQGLDKDDQIVVYCSGESCSASINAYYYLVSRGFKNVRRYAGGLLDWEAAGYPVDGEMVIAH